VIFFRDVSHIFRNLPGSLKIGKCHSFPHAAATEVLKINPKFSLEQIEKTTPHKDPAIRARFIDSLRKAGLK